MSVGLYINSIKAWFWGMAGTFAPAGVGTLNSPSFYEDDGYIVLHSRPTGIVTALWEIGSHRARISFEGEVTDCWVLNVTTVYTTEGRESAYMALQNLIDGIEAGALYINEEAFTYVAGITIKTRLNEEGTYNGTYDYNTNYVSLSRLPSQIDFDNTFWRKAYYSATIVHEFQHAYDIENGIIGADESELLEQSACEKAMDYLKNSYQSASNDTEKNVLADVYLQQHDYYVEHGGSKAEYDTID